MATNCIKRKLDNNGNIQGSVKITMTNAKDINSKGVLNECKCNGSILGSEVLNRISAVEKSIEEMRK